MREITSAQTSDMEAMTLDRVGTMYDIIADLKHMSYMVPETDVAEILGIVALGVKEP